MQDSTKPNLDDTTATGAPLIAPDEPSADATEEPAPRTVNSVDATVGQPIVARVMARKSELEALLAGLPPEDINTRGDIGLALSTINELLTGDLASVPAVVAADMNRWLERNKHLAERATT